MKVTIHTRRVREELWNIPAAGPDIADEEILAVVAGQRRGQTAWRLDIQEFDIADPYVFSRGETDLESIGRRLAEARAAVDRVMEEAKAATLPRLEERSISERKAAADLGVDRNTVRAWRGVAPRGGPARDIAASG